ncbi:(2Fe-2S)-binding protein [soil metagenome]
MSERVRLQLDGVATALDVSSETSLLRALRDGGLTATTGACEQGECGSCTVRLDGRYVCSCLVPALVCEGSDVATVRSLLRPDMAAALVDHGAVQCGFCTPGFVVEAERLLVAPDRLTRDEVREGLAGNLCRCTGYGGLLDAILDVDENRRRS